MIPRWQGRSPWGVRRRASGLVLALLGCAVVLVGQAPVPAAPVTWEQLERRGTRFSGVEIRIGDVFDPTLPQESHWIGNLANFLHIETRRQVVAREIPFQAGEPVRARQVHEVERNLRSFRFLKDAHLEPVLEPDGRVKALVHTREAWTLKVSAGINQVGGQRSFGFSLKESNFLGFGKDVALSHEQTTERSVDTVLYRDRQFLGSAWSFTTRYQSLSDGKTRFAELARPFRSLDTPWALSFRVASTDSITTVYNLQQGIYQFSAKTLGASVEGLWARPRQGERVLRWGAGLDLARPQYGAISLLAPAAPLASPPLPLLNLSGRRLQGAHLAWNLYEDAFRPFQNLAGMTHTEDYNLGWELGLRAGLYSKALQSEVEAPFFQGQASKGWQPNSESLLLLRASGTGRREPEGWRNGLFSSAFTAYYQGFSGQTQAAYLQLDAVHQPDPENLLYLGGTEGLRGYGNHLFVGDQRWLLSLEERPFTTLNWLSILQLGFVIYADAGAIRRLDTQHWSRTFVNLGGGLRLGDLKSSLGRVFLITVAFPLVREPTMERYQVVFGNVVKF